MGCFIGDKDGTVKYYKNTGAADSPAYTPQTGASNPLNGIDFGDNASPWCGDLDGDGDNSCFIGGKDGTVKYYKNIGIGSKYDAVVDKSDKYELRNTDEGYVQEYAVCITVIGTPQRVLDTFVDESVKLKNPALNDWFSQKDTLDGVKTLVPAVSNLDLVDKSAFADAVDDANVTATYNISQQTHRSHGTSNALENQQDPIQPICE